MTIDGAGVRRVVSVGRIPGGHVSGDREQGVIGLQVFECQFLIDQFFM